MEERTQPPDCECIEQANALFEKRGDPTRVAPAISLSQGWARAEVVVYIPFSSEKKRGQKPTRLIANYCPFCGVPYEVCQ